jgi:hypothetical protein
MSAAGTINPQNRDWMVENNPAMTAQATSCEGGKQKVFRSSQIMKTQIN